MLLPITSILAGALAFIMLPLTIQISARRAMIGIRAGVIHKAVFGDADDLMLRNSIRAFGNFIEYTPMVLILLALAEAQSAPSQLLWWAGSLFVAGRIVHAVAMTFIPTNPVPRGLAMFTTYGAILIPALWLLYKSGVLV